MKTTFKRIGFYTYVVALSVTIYLLVAHFDWLIVPPFASAATAPQTTQHCPANTDKGAYFQRGTDPTTGAAECGFSYYNACPYSEAVSADDPMCQKAAPQTMTSNNAPAPVSTPVTPAPVQQPSYTCGGK